MVVKFKSSKVTLDVDQWVVEYIGSVCDGPSIFNF